LQRALGRFDNREHVVTRATINVRLPAKPYAFEKMFELSNVCGITVTAGEMLLNRTMVGPKKSDNVTDSIP
jgi:hypothetical protein